jgi:hypothetical protein
MKNKKIQNKHARPFHLHLEYFFRKQYCLLVVMALMMVAALKTDGRVLSLVRQAYAEGFGLVGQYMREETTRVPVTFDIAGRLPTVSGK